MAKRYLDEQGSDFIDGEYKSAWDGRDELFLSIWNISEFIDILVRKTHTKELTESDFEETMKDFQGEMIGLRGKRALIVVPTTDEIIERSWEIAIKERIHVADALQIVTAQERHCDLLVSGDNLLVNHASKFIKTKVVG